MNNSDIRATVIDSIDKKIQICDEEGTDFVGRVEEVQSAPDRTVVTLLVTTDDKEKVLDNSHRRRLPLTILTDEGRSLVTYLKEGSPINREISSVEMIDDV